MLVAGAGMAGLTAARALERRGAQVTVVEARDRVGGRVWTIRDGFARGQHAEAGGDLIEEDHDATFDLARELDLHPVRILRRGFGFYGASARGPMAIQNIAQGFKAMAEPLRQWIADYVHSEQRWDGAVARHLGRVSVAEWLDAERAPDWVKGRFRGLRGLFLADPEDLSLLALVDFFAGGSPGAGEMFRIREGNDALATGIVRELRQPPILLTQLERVQQTAAGILATIDGPSGQSEIAADFLVVAVPASLLWSIDFDPALPDAQREAFARLRTGCATRVLVQFDRRFWVKGTQPRAFGSDQDYGAIWDGSEGQSGRAGILSFLAGGHASQAIRDLIDRDGIDGLVRCVDWLGTPTRVLASKTIVWDDDEWARGGYAYFHPGFDPLLRDWLARPAGRVVFAGEHTSIKGQGYINGAIESGHRAAAEIAALGQEQTHTKGMKI